MHRVLRQWAMRSQPAWSGCSGTRCGRWQLRLLTCPARRQSEDPRARVLAARLDEELLTPVLDKLRERLQPRAKAVLCQTIYT